LVSSLIVCWTGPNPFTLALSLHPLASSRTEAPHLCITSDPAPHPLQLPSADAPEGSAHGGLRPAEQRPSNYAPNATMKVVYDQCELICDEDGGLAVEQQEIGWSSAARRDWEAKGKMSIADLHRRSCVPANSFSSKGFSQTCAPRLDACASLGPCQEGNTVGGVDSTLSDGPVEQRGTTQDPPCIIA